MSQPLVPGSLWRFPGWWAPAFGGLDIVEHIVQGIDLAVLPFRAMQLEGHDISDSNWQPIGLHFPAEPDRLLETAVSAAEIYQNEHLRDSIRGKGFPGLPRSAKALDGSNTIALCPCFDASVITGPRGPEGSPTCRGELAIPFLKQSPTSPASRKLWNPFLREKPPVSGT